MAAFAKHGEHSKQLLQKLRNKHAELTAYRSQVSWRFFQGHAERSHEEEFDDSSWVTASLPMSWDPTQGDAWFRCRFTVPDLIAGINTEGSKIELVSSALICGAEVYVDSKLVLKEDYWTDFRGPRIIIAEDAKPRETHVVAIRAYAIIPVPKGAQAGIPKIEVHCDAVEKVAFELDSFCEELEFATFLPRGRDLVAKVAKEFDVTVFSGDSSLILAEIEEARKKLAPLSKSAKQFKVHLIGHSHIDMNWLWPWKDTVKVVGRDFSTVLRLMDEYADLHFSQSQAVTYKTAEDNFPQTFRGMKEKVKSGNWDVTASTWVEADLNMGGTEALVRQILYAKRYIIEKFGFEPRVCWEPDTFGHVWTMPQIMRKSGLEYYYFMRCGKGSPMFWWEGPDGSRVLAFNSVYNNIVTPRNVAQVARTFYEEFGLRTSMFVYGVGDHGGGPTVEDIKAAHLIRDKPTLPNAVLSSTHAFFNEVSKGRLRIPKVRDELNFTFDGCYTTHGDVKWYNRKCERLLVDAEKFGSMTGTHPKAELLEAWRKLLFIQFHDILDGSAVHETYDHADLLAEEVVLAARKTLNESVKRIASEIRYSKETPRIVVFNPLSWERKDVVKVRVPLSLLPDNPVAVGSHGNRSPVQLDGDVAIFIANAPSLGYVTYYLEEGEPSNDVLARDDLTLENEALKVELDKDSGAIRTLYDKREGRYVFNAQRHEATMPMLSNLLQVLHEAPHGMSAWVIGKITRTDNLVRGAKMEVVERGPVRGRIRVSHEVGTSRITQDVTIYSEIPRVDFDTTIDWAEVGNLEVDSPMMKASFTPILDATKATFEIPFGYIERVADGREFPSLRWVDLSDGRYGLSLLNDCKYGFDVSGNTVRITLVRSAYSPDPVPDQRKHEILYSVYPHRGDWRRALTFRRGYEINHPFEATVLAGQNESTAQRPESESFLSISPENVVVSCLKLAEESDDLIVRIYEATGKGANAELCFGIAVSGAEETDLMEKRMSRLRVRKGTIRMKLGPSDIRTIRVVKAS